MEWLHWAFQAGVMNWALPEQPDSLAAPAAHGLGIVPDGTTSL